MFLCLIKLNQKDSASYTLLLYTSHINTHPIFKVVQLNTRSTCSAPLSVIVNFDITKLATAKLIRHKFNNYKRSGLPKSQM